MKDVFTLEMLEKCIDEMAKQTAFPEAELSMWEGMPQDWFDNGLFMGFSTIVGPIPFDRFMAHFKGGKTPIKVVDRRPSITELVEWKPNPRRLSA